ncbi:protein NLRC3-like isoform X2 [Narcine bancroftii]|uniref:protein NLRC3-like isoform X2 n=1 Tax=Narcine bancroftii TaxID=1343680 RepID=UPI00383145D2
MDTDLNSTISAFRNKYDDYQLLCLTRFHRDRLEQAIEESVAELALMLTGADHLSGPEYQSVTELVRMGNEAGGSKLLLDLVMENGSGARRVMWDSLLKLCQMVPKLNRILRDIWEHGGVNLEYMDTERALSDVPVHFSAIEQTHKESLWRQTKTMRVNLILTKEIKDFPLVDRYAELTVISTIRDQRHVEHELLARGRDHEKMRKLQLQAELEKIHTYQLFHRSWHKNIWNFPFRSHQGTIAVVNGVAGIGKTTMVQKLVHDWATGKLYREFKFVLSFKFRDLNTVDCKTTLRKLILDQYPYFGNYLQEIWKIANQVLFVFDGLDEYKYCISSFSSESNQNASDICTNPEDLCEVSTIVSSLIQRQLLQGCSVLVTTRPTALHLLRNADVNICAEVLGFDGEQRKEYFSRLFQDHTVTEAVVKHLEDNEILYTMSYNPSYCWILGLALGPFFTQRSRDTKRVPKTITQLYSHYIYNIMKNHSRELESAREVLLRVGRMAFTGISQKNIVFSSGDLIKNNLQPSQFLSGFLMKLLEREDNDRSVVYTFPHLTIQEFVAALSGFLSPDAGDIMKILTEAHNSKDGQFEVFLRFVAGLSSQMSAQNLEECLGKFTDQTNHRVIDWIKETIETQVENMENTESKRNLLNTFHYVFESQNSVLAQVTLGPTQTLKFGDTNAQKALRLNPIDCAVLSYSFGFCDTIHHLDVQNCNIQVEELQHFVPVLHRCEILRLSYNKFGDDGVKLLNTVLSHVNCKVREIAFPEIGISDSSALCLENALAGGSLSVLNMESNNFTDESVPALCSLIRRCENLKRVGLWSNQFSSNGKKLLKSMKEYRHGLLVGVDAIKGI